MLGGRGHLYDYLKSAMIFTLLMDKHSYTNFEIYEESGYGLDFNLLIISCITNCMFYILGEVASWKSKPSKAHLPYYDGML
jgi:hypothetical protein